MESNDENWIYFITAQSRYRSRRIDAISSSRDSWELIHDKDDFTIDDCTSYR